MNKSIFILFLLIVATISCNKSDDNIPSGGIKTCKLLSATFTVNGSETQHLYCYDNSGNLISRKHIYSTGDTVIGLQCKYLDNKLQYCYYGDSTITTDTIFYFYDSDDKLKYSIEYNHSPSLIFVNKTEFFYNSVNQVIHTLSHATGDSIYFFVDSNFYIYTGKNVAKIIQYSRSGSSPWDSIKFELTHDNMKNYYKTMGLPATTHYFWSENNIIQMKTVNDTMSTTYSKYNEFGYPIEFKVSFSSPLQNPISEILTYQCK